MRKEEPLEKLTQKQIVDYLLLRRVVLLRVNSVVARHGQRFVRSVIRCGEDDDRGVSDLIGCTRFGKFIAIEVKRKGESATPEQIGFLRQIESSGGLALVAYSLDDVIARFNKHL